MTEQENINETLFTELLKLESAIDYIASVVLTEEQIEMMNIKKAVAESLSELGE